MSAKYYKGRNIDLIKLKNVIENYFKSKEFETQSKSGDIDHIVQARKTGVLRSIAGASRALTITISGESNEFSVSIAEGKWANNLAAVGIGAILTMGISLIPAGMAAGWSKQIETEFNSWLDELIQFSSQKVAAKNEKMTETPNKKDLLAKLMAAREAGILSDAELEQKSKEIRGEIEVDDQRAKLKDLYDAGILTVQEYKTKKDELEKRIRKNKLEQALKSGLLTKEEYERKLNEDGKIFVENLATPLTSVTLSPTEKMRCQYCGSNNLMTAPICNTCGNKINA
jgi:hypothetical protein